MDEPRASTELRSRGFRSHSRQAIIAGVAAFVVYQAGLWSALFIWPELRDPFYGYKAAHLVRRTVNNRQQSFTVIMLGSSRAAYGLQGGRLEQRLTEELRQPVVAFNFGVPGAGPVMQLLHYQRLSAAGVRPDLLLLEVLPPLLDGKFNVPWEQHWLLSSRLRLDELPLVQRYGFAMDEVRRTWLEALALPCYAYRYAIVSRLSPAWLPWNLRQDWGRGDDPSGSFLPPRETTAERYQQALERAHLEYAAYLADYRLGGPECAALTQLLQRCRADKVPVVLVIMPESPTFRSWYTADSLTQIQEYLSKLSRRFESPVVDARDWLSDGNFSDGHHLLLDGAVAFTERFSDETARHARQMLADKLAIRTARDPSEGYAP